jgi:hypothetical protein
MADTHVETSELNQDSLDGNSASNSEVGSAEELGKVTEDSNDIAASTGDAEDDESADVPEAAAAVVEESREAEGEAPKPAAANGTNGVADHAQNGKNGSNLEADSTEVDAAVGEKRKSLVADDVTISPKKAKIDGEETAAVDEIEPANGQHEAAVV